MTETATETSTFSDAAATSKPESPFSNVRILPALTAVFALAVLADWLFYGHGIGVAAAPFLLALAIGAVVANKTDASGKRLLSAAMVFVLAVIPIVIEPGFFSILLATLGAAYFVLIVAGGAGAAWQDRTANSVFLLLNVCWQTMADLRRLLASRLKEKSILAGAIAWTAWTIPLVLGSIFLSLFASANPLIERWLTVIDWKSLLSHISVGRIFFWLMAIALIWPFVLPRARRKSWKAVTEPTQRSISEEFSVTLPDMMFGNAAILRSLIVFNLLFGMQTVLDIAYLWGGIALPDGMSHASYAHRGAYPLIVTALLAAGFVIAATKPKSDADRSNLIRNLVFLFVAQNVMLVVSSILRLDLYVEAYSLTYWRLAAFIWMGLVALGLILIVARMALRRSNGWLLGMNFGALALTLYLCGYVSFPKLIAHYNVTHSREMSGQGTALDIAYLKSLGPQAIPAMDTLLRAAPTSLQQSNRCVVDHYLPHSTASCLTVARDDLAARHEASMRNWRNWSYRDWHISRYLEKIRQAQGARRTAGRRCRAVQQRVVLAVAGHRTWLTPPPPGPAPSPADRWRAPPRRPSPNCRPRF